MTRPCAGQCAVLRAGSNCICYIRACVYEDRCSARAMPVAKGRLQFAKSPTAPLPPVTPYTTYGARRAVWTHYGPTQIHQACYRLQPSPSEVRQRWHYERLSSPQLVPDPFTISDDYGPDGLGAVGAWAPPPLPPGPQNLPWTRGRIEQRAD